MSLVSFFVSPSLLRLPHRSRFKVRSNFLKTSEASGTSEVFVLKESANIVRILDKREILCYTRHQVRGSSVKHEFIATVFDVYLLGGPATHGGFLPAMTWK